MSAFVPPAVAAAIKAGEVGQRWHRLRKTVALLQSEGRQRPTTPIARLSFSTVNLKFVPKVTRFVLMKKVSQASAAGLIA